MLGAFTIVVDCVSWLIQTQSSLDVLGFKAGPYFNL